MTSEEIGRIVSSTRKSVGTTPITAPDAEALAVLEIAYQLAVANEREAEKGIARIEDADYRVVVNEKLNLEGALRSITNQLRRLATDEQIFGTIGRKLLLDLANEADKL